MVKFNHPSDQMSNFIQGKYMVRRMPAKQGAPRRFTNILIHGGTALKRCKPERNTQVSGANGNIG